MSYNSYQLSRAKRRQFTTNPAIDPATTYSGEEADFFIAPALKAGDTLANNWVTQLDGLSNKAVVTGASIADTLIQEATCDFNDGDSVTVDERVLTLKDYQVNEQLCRARMLPTWNSVKGTRNSDFSTPEFRNFILAQVAAKTAEGVENQLWTGYDYTSGGGTANPIGFLSDDGTFDRAGFGAGILVCGAAAGDYSAAGKTNGVAVTTMDNTNVIEGMNAVYSSCASKKPQLMSKPDLAFYVNPKTFSLYLQALTLAGGGGAFADGQGYNNQVTNQNIGNPNFLGIPIYKCPGMPNDAIVLACTSNLFVGSNLRTDYTQVTYVPIYQFDGSDNVRVSMRFGLGMQVGTPEEVFVGSTAAILPA